MRRLWRWLLRWVLPPGHWGEAILGDLEREREEREARRPGGHGLWYLWETLKLFVHYLGVRLASPVNRGSARRAGGGESMMGNVLQDVRYALRTLRRSPGFGVIAVVTLALGIGANSAIFSVVNGVLLEPLPYRAPAELVKIESQFPGLGFDRFWISPPEYREFQRLSRSFETIGAYRVGAASLSGGEGEPVRVRSAVASAELFTTLGVAPALGRAYTSEEDVQGGPGVVVLSHELWQGALGGDPALVGETVEVNGVPTTVVGIMPPGFDVDDAGVQAWRPLQLPENPTNHGSHFLYLIGRLADGATPASAAEEMRGLVARWEELVPEGHMHAERHPVVLFGLQADLVAGVRPALMLLLGAVGLVLLIACANVGNLMLARAESRQKEVAVRVAMGAGRWRMVRQFLTEGLILSLAGGALGLWMGYAGVRALLNTSPDSIPRSATIGLDHWVLLFTLGVSLLAGLLFGLAPALHLSPGTMAGALKEGGLRSTATVGRHRLRRSLVVAEVALAVLLVVGAGLLIRSFGELRNIEPGFEPEGILTFQLFLPQSRYPEGADASGFLERLRGRLAEVTGVTDVAFMSGLPPVRDVNANDTEFEGLERTSEGPAHNVDYYQVVAGPYFEVMGIPMVSGRAFGEGDDAVASPVAIINERLAEVFYPDQNPIGRRLSPCCDNPMLTIVGVSRDVKQGGLSEPTGTELYLHYPQVAAAGSPQRQMSAVVKTRRDPMDVVAEARRAVWALDPALPLAQVQSMEENVAGSMSRTRFLTLLLGIFAGVALLLAAVGTYGVIAYTVAERSREIGIRIAVGASAGSILAMVLKNGMAMAAVGLGLGIIGALAVTRLLRSLLFGVSATDPVTFLVAPAVLLLAALLASAIPAIRAVRTDPATVLREE